MNDQRSPTYQVRLYDAYTGVLEAIVPNWSALSYARRTVDAGQFTLEIPRGEIGSVLARSEPLVQIYRNGQHELDGIVKHSTYDAVNERWLLQGQDLTWFLSGRTVLPASGQEFDAVNDVPVESAVLGYIDRHLVNPINAARSINAELAGITFSLAAGLGRGAATSHSARHSNLMTVVTDLLTGSDLWLAIARTAVGYELAIHAARDRTYGSSDPVVFTVNRGTVLAQTWTLDRQSTTNVVYVLGDGEGAARTMLEVGTPDGFRREESIDARNETTTAQMTADGDTFLTAELALVETVQLTPSPHAMQSYRDDWDLGDVVTFAIPDLGISLDKQIVEVAITPSTEQGGEGVVLALGAPPPTWQRMVAREFRRAKRVSVA